MYTLTVWFRDRPAQRMPYIASIDVGKQLMGLIGNMPNLTDMELRDSESWTLEAVYSIY